MEKINKRNDLIFNLLLITIFFNIWFPKAGIKMSGIPLTIGNIMFAITFAMWFFIILRRGSFKISKVGVVIFLGIMYSIIKFIFIGQIIENIGYIIPLIIYPLIFFVIYDIADNEEKLNKILKIIIIGFFFLTIYALLQFLFGIDRCTIPGLTVNYTDFKELGKHWYMTKANGLDLANAKIVSTYQNGNLFGVNILLFYPIVYYYLKKKNNTKLLIASLILFISTIFLSLSRACWLGIVLFIFFGIFLKKSKTKNNIIYKLLICFLCFFSLIIVFKYMPSVANRFLNTKVSDWVNMSGRTDGLKSVLTMVLDSGNIFAWVFGPNGIVEYRGIAYEMLPLSLFLQTGIIGLIQLYYVFFKSTTSNCKNNVIDESIKISILIYLIVSLIEGGYWLPPTALNVFLLIGLKDKINDFKGELK